MKLLTGYTTFPLITWLQLRNFNIVYLFPDL